MAAAAADQGPWGNSTLVLSREKVDGGWRDKCRTLAEYELCDLQKEGRDLKDWEPVNKEASAKHKFPGLKESVKWKLPGWPKGFPHVYYKNASCWLQS